MFAKNHLIMKKIALAAAIMFALGANAQDKGNIEFGINTGLNITTASVRDSNVYFTADGSVSFNIGASFDYYFSDRWSIKVKPTYDRKGWDNGGIEIDGSYYSTDYNTTYLTIPVMANWHFGGRRNWYLNFGPYVGFLLSAKDTEFDTDVKDGFETTDFGLALGIGYKIKLNDKVKLFLEYEEQAGLVGMFKDDEGFSAYTSRSAINIGVNFLLK